MKRWIDIEHPKVLAPFFLLMALALIPRFIISLQVPDSLSIGPGYEPDISVIALMGKHVLEKGEFPWFFWGQNWFGGLEAFLHGVAFWIWGLTPWAMRMVSLFLYSLFCMLTYLIGRDLYHERAGLWALLWCVFAPMKISMLSLVPHTHYLETLVFGQLLLWLAILIVKSESARNPKFLYLPLGFFGGLAWWVSPLIMYYLPAIAIYLVLRLRWQFVNRGLIYSLPAFLIGASPFIIYYVMDENSNLFGVGEGFHWSHLSFGIRQFFLNVGPAVLDIPLFQQWGTWAWLAVVSFHLMFIVFFVVNVEIKNVIFRWLKKGEMRRSDGLFLIFIFCVILEYSASSHSEKNITRYLMPLLSWAPIAFAAAVVHSKGWLKCLMMAMALFYLSGEGRLICDWALHTVPSTWVRSASLLQLSDGLIKQGINRAYYHFVNGSTELTFLSKEKVICSDFQAERYAPYQKELELSDRFALINGYPFDSFRDTLKIMGGKCSFEEIGGFEIAKDFKAPERQYRQISLKDVQMQSSHESNHFEHMVDRVKSSHWGTVAPRKEGMWVQWDLGKSYDLGMIRLWNRGDHHMNYALDISLDVSLDGIEWTSVIERTKGDFFYWSGLRPYYWEFDFRQEVRFGPVHARFLRIHQYENHPLYHWMISEAYIYEDVGEKQEFSKINDIYQMIEKLKLKKIYADRWLNAKIQDKYKGKIWTVQPFTCAIARYFNQLENRDLILEPGVGFILDLENASEFETFMNQKDVVLERYPVADQVIYRFRLSGSPNTDEKIGYWTGLGGVDGSLKTKAQYLYEKAASYELKGKDEEALQCLAQALSCYENHPLANQMYRDLLRRSGREEEADQSENHYAILTRPTIQRGIDFGHRITFLGYRIDHALIKRGTSVRIRYYWRIEEKFSSSLGVFVHFRHPARMLQGDHPLLADAREALPALEGEVFSQEEILVVPEDAPAGSYPIYLGLFDVGTGKRQGVFRTTCTVQDQAVLIGALEVTS